MVISRDVIFADGIGLYMPVLWVIRSLTQKYVTKCIKILANSVNNIIHYYLSNNINVYTCIMDREFDCLCPYISAGVDINVT